MAEFEKIPAIVGLGKQLGSRVVTNENVAQMLGVRLEAVQRLMNMTGAGIEERRWIGEDPQTGEKQTITSLAYQATIDALKMAQITADKITSVVLATSSPKYLSVPEGAAIQNVLQMPFPTNTYDLVAACAGWIKALENSYCSLTSPFGRPGPQLVVGAEVLSVVIHPSARATFVLFADAAGSSVVDLVKPDGEYLKPVFEDGSDGSRATDLYIKGGGSFYPASEETVKEHMHVFLMNGSVVKEHAQLHMGSLARRVLEKAGIDVQDVDLFVPHQANKQIILDTAEEVNLPREKVFINIDRVGNTSAASIPVALHDAWTLGRLRRNDVVLMTAFGAGFVSSAGLMQMIGLPKD